MIHEYSSKLYGRKSTTICRNNKKNSRIFMFKTPNWHPEQANILFTSLIKNEGEANATPFFMKYKNFAQRCS